MSGARVVLPEAARLRVMALADDELGVRPAAELPGGLRPFKGFAPAKRARSAAAALAAALETDPAFRTAVGRRAREAFPELATELESGRAPAAADPVLVAALAYLLRPDGWAEIVALASATIVGAVDAEALVRAEHRAGTLAAEVESLRAALSRSDRERRAEVDELKRAAKTLQHRVRGGEEDLRKADARTQAVEGRAAAATTAGERAEADAQRRERKLLGQLAQLEADLEVARRGVREARVSDDVRLRVLLDTVVEAAAGLRRELALPPTSARPADFVVDAGPAGSAAVSRGLAHSDPAWLDALLMAPQAHLIVDGYNVTKAAYSSSTLEEQRKRLVHGLGALAARTGAEVTVIFDGAEMAGHVVAPRARGVRVRFSAAGQIADDLIATFVRAEPPGRALVVVSSDREVAEHAASCGATPVASAALIALLARS